MKLFRLFIVLFLLIFSSKNAHSCSAYKVTVGGHTLFGVNFDTWTINPKIWFETKGYGAVFSGANYDKDGLRPQSGMNEYGLAFGTLATPTPQNRKEMLNKKQITSRVNYLKDILHSCKTVEEVKAYIEQYDYSALQNDVFIYTDRSGKYLIVEPYTLTLGNENKYVLANFCPSTITDFSTIKQERYINGAAFLKTKIDTSVAFCTALSDTMHVCRNRIGDGTLLTSIWNPTNGSVYLYFYHDYKHQVKLDLRKELAKGDHLIEIASLFPANPEYQKLLDFKTPANNNYINKFILACFILFLLSFIYFGVAYFRNRKIKYSYFKLLLAVLSLFMAYYMTVLVRESGVFYFPAPYKSSDFGLIDIASYLPYVILLLIIPLLIINITVINYNTWGAVSKLLLTLNSFAYIILLILFFYWGLYNVFN